MIPTEIVDRLSTVWAKSPTVPGEQGLSLIEHTIRVLKRMSGFINLYRKELQSVQEVNLPRVLLYAALLHDFGKVHPLFQERLRGGPPFGLRHEILSLAFISRFIIHEKEASYLAVAIALHHKDWRWLLEGSSASPVYFQPLLGAQVLAPVDELAHGLPSEQILSLLDLAVFAGDLIAEITQEKLEPYGVVSASFDIPKEIHRGLILIHQLVGNLERRGGRGRPTVVDSQAVYQGILTRGLMLSADHLASASNDDDVFLINEGFTNVGAVLELLGRKLEELWFHQTQLCNTVGHQVLIAPTGSGKTESALLWAGCQREGGCMGRVFFLLPYRASMNAMSDRLGRDFGKDSVSLIHGKSLLSAFEKLMDQGYGTKEAIEEARQKEALVRMNTVPIRVCSPYQIFRSFFGFKGYEASLCSFLSAQLIFDEIHAYDTQITAMILASTKFLCERLSARVLFMSATMPTHLLESIKNLFPGLPEPIRPSQKMLSQSVRHKVHLLPCHVFSSGAIENIVAAAEKGSVLVVVNRVARAVELAKMLRLHGIEDIILLHSRFCPRDRSAKEKQLAPKKGRILVATQVVEVSLDIDYDTGFFELAPLESLLQRFGRVNRYGYRPPSSVYVFEVFDQELNKAAKPYSPIHLSCVLNVLQEFIKDNETCVWSELDTQRLLDISYPLELKEDLLKEIQERVEEYDKYFVRELRPFGAKNIETMKSLQENWDKLFDGYEVLPEELFSEAMNCKNSLSVAQLLVPILSRQFMRLLHDGRLFWNKDINEYVARCEYDSEYGMNFKC